MNQTKEQRNSDQRRERILGKSLKIGLDTIMPQESPIEPLHKSGFTVKDPGTGVRYISHPATTNGVDISRELLLGPESCSALELCFDALPAGIAGLFQRLNFRQIPMFPILGLEFARFPTRHEKEEKPFLKRLLEEEKPIRECFNLDCFSKTKEWNPLFVKYHWSAVPALRNREYGYLQINASQKRSGQIEVKIYRVNENDVPVILKTATTFPR